MIKELAAAAALTGATFDLQSQVLPPCPVGDPIVGLNLIGNSTNTLDTSSVTGPGLRNWETIAAPQNNPALYQKNISVIEFEAHANGSISSAKAAMFGSHTVTFEVDPSGRQPDDLRTAVRANIIFSVWTNGISGFQSRPTQPDFQFNAGSNTNLVQSGSLTNGSTIYPIFLATADLSAAGQCYPIHAGEKYAFALNLKYSEDSTISTFVARTKGDIATTVATPLSGAFCQTTSSNNVVNASFTAMSFDFVPEAVVPPFDSAVRIEPIAPGQLQLSLQGSLGGHTFTRFEAATRIDAPANEWTEVPLTSAPGEAPKALVATDGEQKFFRAVFQ